MGDQAGILYAQGKLRGMNYSSPTEMVRQKSRTREVNTILLELEANRGLPFLIPTGKLPNARDAPSIPLELNPHRRAARAPCQQAQFRAVVQEWEAEAAPSAY